MNSVFGLDFETYGAVDLPKHGLDRYINDVTFQPLIGRIVTRNRGVQNVARLDFIHYPDRSREILKRNLEQDRFIVAHNAPFERAVLRWLDFDLPLDRFIDSAVVARAAGAESKLEAAAPQLLNTDKLETGWPLIKLFSMPGKLQEANGSLHFDPDIIKLHPQEWKDFGDYCTVDADLGLRIYLAYRHLLTKDELDFNYITEEMNLEGWHVDEDSVHLMQQRYEENKERELLEFRERFDQKGELNFNSFPQLKAWCEARGVKAKSFDEQHVEKMLATIQKKLASLSMSHPRYQDLIEVEQLLLTKQILGGSSLAKLQKILDLVSADGQLRGQYLHCGAGQTRRTSGRGVQMQNLKQMHTQRNMDTLKFRSQRWTNDELAENIRQVFTSRHPQGQLIVGDFSSVESRGLAYLAGAEWKLDAFRQKRDMYKVLAAKIDGTAYDAVTKDRRQFGKVGELSCGYQAGAGAVRDFAAKMGTALTEGEASQLVSDWRDTNPEVVALWDTLDSMLRAVVDEGSPSVQHRIGNQLIVEISTIETPQSLLDLHPKAQSIRLQLKLSSGNVFLSRYFHGCYMRGRDVCYYKPTERKTGPVWKNHYRHPKSKEVVFFKLYGGKLAGILTQSMCRELFFHSLKMLSEELAFIENATIIGQFHDEIVVDWWPASSGLSLDDVLLKMYSAMTDHGVLAHFPLAAEIKHDYRYTK